jgi:SNF2 family DNA or RNA helicase
MVTIGRPTNEKLLGLLQNTKVSKVKPEDYYAYIPECSKPWNHQRRILNEAIPDLLSYGSHALLMEMSTGKTKTTLDVFSVMVSMNLVGNLLIIAPAALCSAVWLDEEIPKHLSTPYVSYLWDGRTTKKKLAEYASFLEGGKPRIMVVNVEAFQNGNLEMRRQVRSFLEDKPTLMAVDESSFIKGPTANRAKLVIKAGKLATYRMILTGTEIQHSPLDLFMQFEFLKEGYFGVKSFFLFKSKYAVLVDAYGAGARMYKKVVGYQLLNDLMEKVAAHSSRARKKDCFDLPSKIHVTMHVEMSAKQKAVYQELKDSLATFLNGELFTIQAKNTLFAKFRQITGGTIKFDGERHLIDEHNPKLEALIADLQGTDEQAIIWAVYQHEVDIIAHRLLELGTVGKYNGEVKQEDRDRIKAEFQEGKIRFLVANPTVGSFGLNLQNCHIQYDYSLDPSPGKNVQKEDRIHRPGQTFECVYKTLVARGTVDERLAQLIERGVDILEGFASMTIKDFISLI